MKKVPGKEDTDTESAGDMSYEYPASVTATFSGADALTSHRTDRIFNNQAQPDLTICNHPEGEFGGQAIRKRPGSPNGLSTTDCGITAGVALKNKPETKNSEGLHSF